MKKILKKTVTFAPVLLLIFALFFSLVRLIDLRITQLTAEDRQGIQIETAESTFDTSVLENWCGGTDGTVRMVSGWKLEEAGENIRLEDETGNIWEVENLSTISYDDFLLLWIADNNTPDDVSDDIVIKVWQESWG